MGVSTIKKKVPGSNTKVTKLKPSFHGKNRAQAETKLTMNLISK